MLQFKSAQNRYYVTEWSLQSSASPVELKILDASKKGGTCTFVNVSKNSDRFLGLNIFVSYKDNGTVTVTEVSAEDDDSTNYLARKNRLPFRI